MARNRFSALAPDLHSRKRASGPVTHAVRVMQQSVDRPTRLSELFRNPRLRDAFRRAERDNDGAFAVPAPKPSSLNGGASVKPERAMVLA